MGNESGLEVATPMEISYSPLRMPWAFEVKGQIQNNGIPRDTVGLDTLMGAMIEGQEWKVQGISLSVKARKID